MWKEFANEYLSFSKKERTGIIIMLTVIALSVACMIVSPYFITPKKYDHSGFEKQISFLKTKTNDSLNTYTRKNDYGEDTHQPFNQPYENRYSYSKEQQRELFYFDPNTLTDEGWQRLGVKEKTIATIKNYLSKGGQFKQPEDIKKIWGMSEVLAEKLIHYIQIEKREWTEKNENAAKPLYEKKLYTPSIIDINKADTTALIALPGIGNKLAQRIITFRDKLGGFYKVEQVAETFGLADSVFQKIKSRLVINDPAVKIIHLNTANLDELKQHPYIRYAIANAIIQYRAQHGPFAAVSDLKKIIQVTDDIYKKLLPYVQL